MADYGILDRLLHRLALQVTPLAELSFDLDQKLSGPVSEPAEHGRHVFVSGLARAGTTILMRRIYASGEFCSLTYRNMPFVLAPNGWGRLIAGSRRKGDPTERAHGDRILVDIDSPESLDEVFWRIFDGQSYIGKDCLVPHEPDDEIVGKFAAYIAAILKADAQGRTRYLSKNNNNILRLGRLHRAFPRAVILIPFREPVAHAGSLLRQHRNFVAQQRTDPFVRSYMTWLGHHEFGLDHRPFRFDGAAWDRSAMGNPDSLPYWLNLWCQVYGWLETTAPKNARFVCYEDLCADPGVWRRLAEICGLPQNDESDEPFIVSKAEVDESIPPRLADDATILYRHLVDRTRAAPLVRDAVMAG